MNEQLIDKVKKLLELANSPNENEAKLAFQRAQSLIAKYSLNLNDSENLETIVETICAANFPRHLNLTNRYWLCETIGHMFGCHCFTRGDNIVIVGFPTNTTITIHGIDCIMNQLIADYRAGFRNDRSISFAISYWDGAIKALKDKFKEEKVVGEGLVVYDKAKEYLKKYNFGSIQSGGATSNNNSGYDSGINAGNSASIRSGVTVGNGKLLG